MFRRPDVDEVTEYGRAMGFDLTPTEARMIQARMMDTVAALEAFDEMRVEERRPPLEFTDRDPGGRPSEQEDPLGAFITKCRVKGADSGPLARQDGGAQGPHRAGGRAAHLQLAHDGRLRPRLRRHRRHAPARRRGHHRRQAQDGGVLVGWPRALRRGRLRAPAQSAQPRARDRRLVVGVGRGGGGRAGGHRARGRSGRLDPAARRVVRHRGTDADARARAALRRLRTRAHHRLRGADGAHGGRRGGIASVPGRPRRPRPAPGRRAREPARVHGRARARREGP